LGAFSARHDHFLSDLRIASKRRGRCRFSSLESTRHQSLLQRAQPPPPPPKRAIAMMKKKGEKRERFFPSFSALSCSAAVAGTVQFSCSVSCPGEMDEQSARTRRNGESNFEGKVFDRRAKKLSAIARSSSTPSTSTLRPLSLTSLSLFPSLLPCSSRSPSKPTPQLQHTNSFKMVQPLVKRKSVKKHPKGFRRHQSDTNIGVKDSWRRPKGIDSRVRRKFKGCGIVMPNIGYGTAKKTRHQLPNGLLKFLVHNAADLDVLLMHNRKYCAEVAHGVSSRKRKEIVERARELNVSLTNGDAKLRSQEE
jgi:large subunit ribosomal protein L32e